MCKKHTEKLQPQLSIFLVSITDSSLGESIPSNFIGNVGSTQGRAGDTETLLDNISKDVDIIAMNINTLPIQLVGIKMKREKQGVYTLIRLIALASFRTLPSKVSNALPRTATLVSRKHKVHPYIRGILTLVRSDKDQGCSVLDGLFQVGDSYDIVLELNTGEVLSVFVLRIDNFSKLLALKLYDQESAQIPQTIEKPDLFLIHPNSDARIVKDVGMFFSVHTSKSSNSRTPLHLSHQPSALLLTSHLKRLTSCRSRR